MCQSFLSYDDVNREGIATRHDTYASKDASLIFRFIRELHKELKESRRESPNANNFAAESLRIDLAASSRTTDRFRFCNVRSRESRHESKDSSRFAASSRTNDRFPFCNARSRHESKDSSRFKSEPPYDNPSPYRTKSTRRFPTDFGHFKPYNNCNPYTAESTCRFPSDFGHFKPYYNFNPYTAESTRRFPSDFGHFKPYYNFNPYTAESTRHFPSDFGHSIHEFPYYNFNPYTAESTRRFPTDCMGTGAVWHHTGAVRHHTGAVRLTPWYSKDAYFIVVDGLQRNTYRRVSRILKNPQLCIEMNNKSSGNILGVYFYDIEKVNIFYLHFVL